jgi:hypothetical protein
VSVEEMQEKLLEQQTQVSSESCVERWKESKCWYFSFKAGDDYSAVTAYARDVFLKTSHNSKPT